jgi:hypothetical protein
VLLRVDFASSFELNSPTGIRRRATIAIGMTIPDKQSIVWINKLLASFTSKRGNGCPCPSKCRIYLKESNPKLDAEYSLHNSSHMLVLKSKFEYD